jgi:hypothetical protein
MTTQFTDLRFDIGFKDSEPRKISSVHQLSSSRLVELLGKLDSHEDFTIHLRGKGFEIYGDMNEGNGARCNSSLGIITSGYNLDKSDSLPYLVGFDYTEGEDKTLVPVTSLVDVVRDYIIM